MRKTLLVAALAATQFASPVSAQEGNWLVRLRAVHIATENKSEPIPALAVPTDAIHISDEWIPEVSLRASGVTTLALEKDIVGLSVGRGIDIRLGLKVFLIFDLKKVQIEADVSTPAARVSKVKLDPWLFGIGLG